MTLTTPYSATFYVGDGETKTFPYLFEEVSESFISVIVYNSLTGQSSTPTYIVDTDQKQVIFGDDTPAPTADETVCIYRNTPNVQDTPFRTLQGYDAKALENILSKIVAMIQEIKSNYFSTQVLQGDPWQLDLLTSADDGATVNIDYTAKKLVKGLYFQIADGNLQVSADGSAYITMPKSVDVAEFRQFSITLEDLSVIKKLQYRVGNEWFDAETNAQATADEALALAQTVQGGLSSHVSDTNNPHETSISNLTDTNINTPVAGQFIMFDGLKWKNVNSSAIAGWGTIIGNITDQTDLMNKFTEYVRTDGTSIMTQPLLMRATDDFKCAIAPYWDGVGFFKLNDNNSVTLMASIEYNSGFEPATTNTYNIGALTRKWKNLYLSGKAYMSVINNGYDIAVPVTNSADTLALKSEVDLAANSGDQLTEKGVWYAKMYSATVAPSAEDGTNYADFSQTDGQGNPIIVIYKRQNGAWVQDQTITPPAEYNGYVPVTSKIWDIVEQAGQQGGKVLWSHNQKTFTPSPLIISFEDAALTGTPTAPTLNANSPSDQIATKEYVDNNSLSVRSIDATIVGTLSINESTVSGFSLSNYLALPGILHLAGSGILSFEIDCSFTTPSNMSNPFTVFDGAIDIIMGNGPQVLKANISDGTNTQTVTGTTTLTASTKYYVKFEYDGTNYNLWLSSDGITYNLEATDVATIFPEDRTINKIGASANPITSTNLSDWAIKRNGQTIWQGIDAPGLQQRVATGHQLIAFQAPTINNNYTWYRKYADGWVEQGGLCTDASGDGSVTLPVTMADTNYFISANNEATTAENAWGWVYVRKDSKTTTGFGLNSRYGSGADLQLRARWMVCGMAA